jgi:exosortase/archaeosortase family protein
MGLPAVAEGFTITMDDVRIGVVEACNGLGMLVMFFAYATAAVFLIRRPLIDKIVIMLSAVPIALGANIARITLTGLMHATLSKETAEHFYHDLAGWLMMPMALMAFWLELKLLDWLFVEVEPVGVDATFSMVGGAKAKRTNRPENLD